MKYDQALHQLHQYGPSTAVGFINHAPMVAEVMYYTGQESLIESWLKNEWTDFTQRPDPYDSINSENWQDALSSYLHYSDWVSFFQASFKEQGWQNTLNLWCQRLAPGFTTAACHGVLRSAHAVRSLQQQESEERLNELAEGLSVWASMYSSLPIESTRYSEQGKEQKGTQSLSETLWNLNTIPDQHRPEEGFITSALQLLPKVENFSHDIAQADLSGPVELVCERMIIAFAELFTKAAHSEFSAIVFAHTITSVAAIKNLLAVITEETARRLLFHAWQSGCAFRVLFFDDNASKQEVSSDKIKIDNTDKIEKTKSIEKLYKQAFEHGDDHVIKLTEACLSTYEKCENPVLIQVSQQVKALVAVKEF